ncbi:DEAD/DEAH box helicase [Bacillus testis]|uniref:DEAD/DEAH box helicase n=1 Tax=Bacillus testis TaxID=1622072 RepID=UPI00067E9810|nr:AAA domain-containing protein [Bacillus testis]
MELTSIQYIKAWTKALQAEIAHLKKYGSNKYALQNGRQLTGTEEETYYFESRQTITVPAGAQIKLQWGKKIVEGRILSSEGKGIILVLDESLGDHLSEAYLMYDPWQLLDELAGRLAEIKKSKIKRARIKRLLNPDMPNKYRAKQGETSVKELYNRSQVNPVTYVWGPPGTGKTYTLARVAANKYLHHKTVLVLAQSNAAVNVLMAEMSHFLEKTKHFKEGDIIRYGAHTDANLPEKITLHYLLEQSDPTLVHEKNELLLERNMLKQDLQSSFSNRDSQKLLKLETKWASIMEKMKKKEHSLIKDAKVLGTTLAKAAMDPAIYEHQFDIAIVDEASMCYVPQAAFAASLAKRIIVCGDFKQLPPIANSQHPEVAQWLKEDIFHKSGVADTVRNGPFHPHLLLLNEQRRMHPDISAFTNKHVYHSLVHDYPGMAESTNRIVKRGPFNGQASILVDTSFTGYYGTYDKTSRSRWNPWQLFLSFQLLHEAILGGATSLGYVTPYRVQAQLMDDLLEDFYPMEKAAGQIVSATVHRFQGSEKEVMVFDSVDCWPQERPGILLVGKESERLINVAITRTKGKFIHVANCDYIRRKTGQRKTHRLLVEHQMAMGQAVKHQSIGMWAKNHHERLKWVHAKKLDDVFTDVRQAKKEIILSLPREHNVSPVWLKELKKINDSVAINILSDAPSDMEFGEPYFAEVPFPFVLIDRRILWLGQPFEQSKGVLPPYVAIRLDSMPFIASFLGHLGVEGLD